MSAILDRAETLFPNNPLPSACVGVFDNHPIKRFNFELLRAKLLAAEIREDGHLLGGPTPVHS